MTKPSLDHRIGTLAARQYGVFGRDQVMSVGAGRGFIQHRLRSGRWERIAHNVFRVRGAPLAWRQSLLTACLSWGEGAAISHRAAAVFVGLAGFEKEIVEVTVPQHRRGRGPGIVHRNMLQSVDVITRERIPVTTAARTLIDVASIAPRDRVEEALDDALRRGMVSIARMRWRLAEVGGKGGRPGVTMMRALLDTRETTGVPQSVFETRLLRTLQDAGLHPVLQYPVRDGAGLIGVVDFAFPSERVAVEADGYRWHSARARWDHDLQRRNRMTALGWRVIHITWTALSERPQDVIDSVRRTLGGNERVIG
jgi:very-short-patch-repair endonuclease